MKRRLDLGVAQILAEATGLEVGAIRRFGLSPEQLSEMFESIPHDKRGDWAVILGRACAARAVLGTLERCEIDNSIDNNPDLAALLAPELERADDVLISLIRRCNKTKALSAGEPGRA